MFDHDVVAIRIAARYNTFYNRGEGADIEANRMAIEVETLDTVEDAERQLAKYRFQVYVAGVNDATTRKARIHYAISDIGVMNSNGDIVKKSSRIR